MNDQGNPTGLYGVSEKVASAISFLTTLGLIVPLFQATHDPVLHYLAPMFGATFGQLLTWAASLVEAYLLFQATKLAFSFFVVWLLTKLTMRGLR